MPDQTPVTDDDRIAHQWESKHRNDGNVGLAAVARAIRAHVPVPPKSISEELRYRETLLRNGDPDGDTPAALSALADRAEELEARAFQAEWHANRYDELIQQRNEARAKVERLTREMEKPHHMEYDAYEASVEMDSSWCKYIFTTTAGEIITINLPSSHFKGF